MPATCFATPIFVFAEPVLSEADAWRAGLKTCASDVTVRLKTDTTDLRD